jgi:glycosyltransferase involved in cell wall biosynthesis
MAKPVVSIISPAYNEAGTIPELVMRVSKVMEKSNCSWEFLVVNDASTDNSRDVMRTLQKKYPSLRPLNHVRNSGQTACFSTGFREAKGDIVITMDSDLEVRPEDIPLYLERMKGDIDVVNGIRTNRKHTFSINFASRIYNILMFLIFRTLTYDSASNFTAFKAGLVRNLKLTHNDHRYILPIVKRRGAREIEEVIIHHDYRKAGRSKYKAIWKFVLGFFEILYAWYRIEVLGEYDVKA